MNATNYYVSTTRLVLQADPDLPGSWQDLYTALPTLRNSLSCTVCENLLSEPYTPEETTCEHHVCKGCKGGVKKLKPTCSWCKDYSKYSENVQLRILIQNYKKLCGLVKITRMYEQILRNSEQGEVLRDIIRESEGEKIPRPLLVENVKFTPVKVEDIKQEHPMETEYREDETVDEIMNSPYSKLKPRPAPPASSLAAAGLAKIDLVAKFNSTQPTPKSSPAPTPPSASPTSASPSLAAPVSATPPHVAPCSATPPSSTPSSATLPSSTPRSAAPPSATPMSATPPSATPPTAASPSTVSLPVARAWGGMRKIKAEAFILDPLKGKSSLPQSKKLEPTSKITKPVFESCQKKQGLLSDFGICSSPKVARDGISVAKVGISPSSKVARDGISASPKVAKAGISPSPKVAKVEESRGSSESEESTGNSCPAPSPSSLKRKGGCRCGNATLCPGKLTCCGQRCPCYVDSQDCTDCKCKGCRNPHRPGGVKVRPAHPFLNNMQATVRVPVPLSNTETFSLKGIDLSQLPILNLDMSSTSCPVSRLPVPASSSMTSTRLQTVSVISLVNTSPAARDGRAQGSL